MKKQKEPKEKKTEKQVSQRYDLIRMCTLMHQSFSSTLLMLLHVELVLTFVEGEFSPAVHTDQGVKTKFWYTNVFSYSIIFFLFEVLDSSMSCHSY